MTNDEINELLAVKVMGWYMCHRDTALYKKKLPNGETYAFFIEDWNPYKNIKQALQCLEAWHDSHTDHWTSIFCDSKARGEVSINDDNDDDSDGRCFYGEGSSFSEAICNALVEAVKYE